MFVLCVYVWLDYYTPDMVGIKVDCEVLGELVRSVLMLFSLYIHTPLRIRGCKNRLAPFPG